MGVWERSIKGRLHFHCLLLVPQNTMPGELIPVRDYSLTTKRMRESFQNTYFNERFGRTDFIPLDKNAKRYGNAVAYILKYMGKTDEKIVYSRDLPMYMISDITEDDVVCRMGMENRKLLLYDDFSCWDEGEYLGNISEETFKKLRKCN